MRRGGGGTPGSSDGSPQDPDEEPHHQQKAVNMNFRGETGEVGMYLGMARQAEREGYPEVAAALIKIAKEEAEHASHYAELNGMISASTKENIERMLQGEQAANKGKRESAVRAKELGIDHAHDYFDESSRDEARHAQMLEGMPRRQSNAKAAFTTLLEDLWRFASIARLWSSILKVCVRRRASATLRSLRSAQASL